MCERIEGPPRDAAPLDWYVRNSCDHAHCPRGCDKPQPFLAADGRLCCGRCSVYGGELVEMIPCHADLCTGPPLETD